MNPAPPNDNWHYVYLLRSKKTRGIYIGCTGDLEKRLNEHVEGKVYSTKKILPVDLVYYEAFNSKELAYKREKRLKYYGSGLTELKTRIGGAG